MHSEKMDALILCAHFLVVGLGVTLFTVFLPLSLYYYYFVFANLLLFFIFAPSTYRVSKWLLCRGRIQPSNKAVLITGCGSGFGKALAKRLDSKGFQVFASCHYPEGEGVDDLKRSCSDRLKILCLDVSKDESVEKAVSFVKKNLESNELWAVVNNAGIPKVFASFDICSFDTFKDTIDVNVYGPIRVTKAFLPLLKKSKGRIVNVNSILGRISFVETCAYSVSKYAGVALTECLSLEMKNWGIRVISIEPDMFRTGFNNLEKSTTATKNEFNKLPKDIASSYGETYQKKLENFGNKFLNLRCNNINNVIDAMESAVALKNPSHVYIPCRNIFAQIFFQISEIIPFDIYQMAAFMVARLFSYPSSKDIAHNNST